MEESGPPSPEFIKEMEQFFPDQPPENVQSNLARTFTNQGVCNYMHTLYYNIIQAGLSSELHQEEDEVEVKHSSQGIRTYV